MEVDLKTAVINYWKEDMSNRGRRKDAPLDDCRRQVLGESGKWKPPCARSLST